MERTLRILLVEDNEDDAVLLVRHLTRNGIDPFTRRVETVETLRNALATGQWDVILCDVSMPDLDALGALREVRAAGSDIPFIVVSGTVPEEKLVELTKAGVHDVIVKDRLSRLVAAIERAIDERVVRSERRHAESALHTSEARFRQAFKTAPHGMALVGLDGRWLQVNKALCDLLGYSSEELLEQDSRAVILGDDLATSLDLGRRVLAGEMPGYQVEKRYVRKDGAVVWILESSALVCDDSGSPLYSIAQSVDLSALKAAQEEQARLETRLRHAQKLESLGTLSGGIAHEFNNLLLPIAGLLEMSLDGVTDRPDIHENLVKSLENTRRAAALVDKILTFSRVDNCTMAQTDVAAAIDQAVSLLRATIPATVAISKELDTIGEAWIDRSQIAQIVMNLGVNAMHSLGADVGRIEFRLTAETFHEQRLMTCGHLPPGRYARLSVTDTGCGMDDATISRIFEPFFTTKDVGTGTGMGLAFVHGVVKNHAGMIDVRSWPGQGTTFDVFLPFEQTVQPVVRHTAAA